MGVRERRGAKLYDDVGIVIECGNTSMLFSHYCACCCRESSLIRGTETFGCFLVLRESL